MEPDDFDDVLELEDEIEGDEADDWDEETLGLDWNEAEAQRLVRDVVPGRWAD
jgi:hypothetical protein